jgi:hypothetical protein
MNIKKEHVDKFISVYEKTFQEKIDYKEAFEQCLQLVLLLSAIYHPMTPEDFKRVQDRRRKTGDL